MHFANVPISLKVQLSSKSSGLVGNVCDTCFGLVKGLLCFTFNMFLHIKVVTSASLAQ